MKREVHLVIGGDRIYLGRVGDIISPRNPDRFTAATPLREAVQNAVADLVFGAEDIDSTSLTIELR